MYFQYVFLTTQELWYFNANLHFVCNVSRLHTAAVWQTSWIRGVCAQCWKHSSDLRHLLQTTSILPQVTQMSQPKTLCYDDEFSPSGKLLQIEENSKIYIPFTQEFFSYTLGVFWKSFFFKFSAVLWACIFDVYTWANLMFATLKSKITFYFRHILCPPVRHHQWVSSVHWRPSSERWARDFWHARKCQHRLPDPGNQCPHHHHTGGPATHLIRRGGKIQRWYSHRPVWEHPWQADGQAGHWASQPGHVPGTGHSH